ncbi:unnamed protein product [Cochlearia groenlandica]
MGSLLSREKEEKEEEKEKKKETSNSSPPPHIPLSSLPNDIVVDCLSRVSKTRRPKLSLVSKLFRSLIFSLELEAIRSYTNHHHHYRIYVCVNLNYNPYPRWLILSPILKPILPSFHVQHPISSTTLTHGSNVYIIGGFVKGKRSKKVFTLSFQDHEWRTLPDMRVPRANPAAEVINGKLCVVGGGSIHTKTEDWGEVFDPKTRTWEPLSHTTALEDLTYQKSIVPNSLVMGGKLYAMNGLFNLSFQKGICFVETGLKELWQICVSSDGNLVWCDPKRDCMEWRNVKGIDELYLPLDPHFVFVESCERGRRTALLWWKSVAIRVKKFKTEIWCAEISFMRLCGLEDELWGVVKWSKNVFCLDICDPRSDFFLHSAILVTN